MSEQVEQPSSVLSGFADQDDAAVKAAIDKLKAAIEDYVDYGRAEDTVGPALDVAINELIEAVEVRIRNG